MASTEIRILQPGDEALLEAFLAPRIESSMILLGNMRAAGLLDQGLVLTGSYAAAFEEGKIVAVAAHYWNQNLIVQGPKHLDLLWRAAVRASGRAIKGLLGPSRQVNQVLESLAFDDKHIQLNQKEKLYALKPADLIVPDALLSGDYSGRRIREDDLELITQWRVAYSIEALGEQDSPALRAECHASTVRYYKQRRTWLLEVEGKPVASSSFNSAIAEAVQIGGVWTPPELRRRGYARAVVAASLLDARAEGAQLAILFTGSDNIPAQKAYLALGFEEIGDYQIVLLREAIAP